ncbi:MAG TPA: aminotransferase class V-fold PLP-dependent enzyme, partial [Gemmatimonadales bacterium]|nr:aminotransferase class V-fold PLP-dependent enzyme [Gemmatimonadales bacterium]
LGASHPLEIVFTGGGTESDNLGVAGPVLAAGPGAGIVTTAVEHEAVLETARFLERLGCPVGIVGVDGTGRVDPAAVTEAVGTTTAVVSVMAANNETGVRQPVAEVAAALAGRPVLVHSDAVQAFVAEEVTVGTLGADLVTLAAHKFGGPKGVGLLRVPRHTPLEPVLHGGGQELGFRSGTHNVAGIVGMAAAMQAAAGDRERFRREVAEERRTFEEALSARIEGLVVTGSGAERLVQHSHLRIPGVAADTLLIRLDGAGLAASAGSACHSGAVTASHVLAAMGVAPEDAASSVRFTFGWTTCPGDGNDAARIVLEALEGLR